MDRLEHAWRRSSYSGANGGNCVEVADGRGAVLVRDSKDPAGSRLAFGLAMWEAFTASVRAGVRSVLSRPGPAGVPNGPGSPSTSTFPARATRVTFDEIGAMRLRLAELCRKYGIAELAVFGSVARGDARPDSDVDLLYVRVPGMISACPISLCKTIWSSSSAALSTSSRRKACTGSSGIKLGSVAGRSGRSG
jgi:hypothetical protein